MPIDRKKIRKIAQKYADKGNLDRAIEEYQKLLDEKPDDLFALLSIGDLYAKQGKIQPAFQAYDKACDVYVKEGRYVKALALYKKMREALRKSAPELLDQFAFILPKMAVVFQRLDMIGDARVALDEYAATLSRFERHREAVEVLRKVVELEPNHPLSLAKLAEALTRLNQKDEAVKTFAKAAEIYLSLRQPESALKVISRILEIRPDPKWLRKAAEIHLARQSEVEAKRALGYLQQLFNLDRENLDTLELLWRVFEQLGQPERAIEVRLEMAKTAHGQGKTQLAQKLVSELLQVAPNNKEILAFARVIGGQPQQAAQAAAPAGGSVSRGQSSVITTEDAEIEVSEAFVELDDDEALDLGDDASAIEALARAESSIPPAGGGRAEQTEYDPGAPYEPAQEAEPFELAPSGPTGAALVDEVLANAEALLERNDLQGALETVRDGLERDPTAFELRFAYKDLLYQTGNYQETVNQLITLAAIYLDAGDEESAGRMLEEAFPLAPNHPRVRQMLLDLGYELPAEQPAPAEAETEMQQAEIHGDAVEPLPSYDLEEIGPEYVLPSSQPEAPDRASLLTTDAPFSDQEQVPQQPSPSISPHEIDEPFGESDTRLPSFPLITEEALASPEEASLELVGDGQAEMRPPMPTELDQTAAEEAARRHVQEELDYSDIETLEGALEQADLYAARGMYDEAFAVLDYQAQYHPNHPLLVERQKEIEDMLAAEQETARAGASEQLYDLDTSLEALDEVIASESQAPPPDEGIDVDEVFAKFKEGVAQQVSQDDTQTHYDLGIAYKEMGLLDDAINELQLAGESSEKECISWSLIGMIRKEQGDLNEAIRSFLRGLHARIRTREQELALYYELGDCYERLGRNQEALYYFDIVASQEPGYRDAQQRAQSLRELSGRRRKPLASASQDEIVDDDLDQAFDDVFGSGGKS